MTSILLVISLIFASCSVSGGLIVEAKGIFGAELAETHHGFKTHSIGRSHRFKSKSHRLHPSNSHLLSTTTSDIFDLKELTSHKISPSRLRALAGKSGSGVGVGVGGMKTAFGWVEKEDEGGEMGAGLFGGVGIEYQGSPELWDDLTDEPVYIATTIDFVPAIPLSASLSSAHEGALPSTSVFFPCANSLAPDLEAQPFLHRIIGAILPFSSVSSDKQTQHDPTSQSTELHQNTLHTIPRTVEELVEAGWIRTKTSPSPSRPLSSPPRAAIGSAKSFGIGRISVAGKDESIALVMNGGVRKGIGRGRGRTRAGEMGMDFKRSLVQL